MTNRKAEVSVESSRQREPYRRVFLSSSSPDLVTHSQLVIDTLLRMNLFPVGIEQFGVRGSSDVFSVSTDKMAEADIYLGIFFQEEWLRVFDPASEVLFVTQQEYAEARKLELPCYVFIARPETKHDQMSFPGSSHDLDNIPPLIGLRDDLLPAVVEYFITPDDLARKVALALATEVKTGQRLPRELPSPNQHFVGRKQEVRNLCETLRNRQSVALVGEVSGVGKSTLAAQVMYLLANKPGTFPGGFVFVRCDERHNLAGLIWIYDQLLSAWNISLTLEDLARVTSLEEAATLREYVLRNQLPLAANDQPAPSLLLLDNVERELPLTRALEMLAALNITVMLTSRTEYFSVHLHAVHLDVLWPPDALLLFKELYISRGGDWVATRDETPAAEVVKMLGYLPLAIELAAACAAHTGASVSTIASDIQEPGVLAKLENSVDKTASVHYALEKSLGSLTPSHRARFAALGLPKGTDWPRLVIEHLFSIIQLDELGTRLPEDSLEFFAELSLVKILSAEIHPSGNGQSSTFLRPRLPLIIPSRVWLHPLLRKQACKEWDKQVLSVQQAALEGLLEGIDALAKEHIQDFAALEREEELAVGALRLAGQKRLAQQRVIKVINSLIGYLTTGGHWQLGKELLTLQLDATRELGDRVVESLTLNNLGSLAEDLGEKEEAAHYYEQALAIRREMGDRKGEGVILNNLGLLAANLGMREEAAHYYEQALAIRREMDDRTGESTTLNNLGVLALEQGKNEEAARYYRQALAILRATGDRAEESTTLNNLGLLMANLGRKEEAARYYEQSLTILHEVGDQAKQGRTLVNLGHLAEDLGKNEEAARYYRQALAILHRVGDRVGEGGALNNLGHLAYSQGKNEEAARYYEQALIILREASDQVGESTILHNLGHLVEDLGKSEEAAHYYEQALIILHRVGDRAGEGTILNNLGNLAYSLGKNEEATRYYELALAIRREMSNQVGEGTILFNLGYLSEELGNNDDAESYYEQALAIWRKIGDRVREGTILNKLGLIAAKVGKKEEAARYYEQALAIRCEVGDRDGEGEILKNLGELAYSLSNEEEAARYYEQALVIQREVGDQTEVGATLLTLGRIAQDLGRKEEAMRYYEQALVIWREIGNQVGEGVTLNNLGALAGELRKNEEAVRYYEQALVIWHEMGNQVGEGTTLNNMGALAAELGRKEEAMRYYDQSLVIWYEVEDREREVITLIDLGHLLNQYGDSKTAVNYFNRALMICEEIGAMDWAHSISQSLAELFQ